jgi:hypothetical protein
VVLDSPTLGYVDALHQSLRTQTDRRVWTFYWALAEGSPSSQRTLLLNKDWSYWKEAILHDPERVHPDIRQCVTRVDIMRFGQAMARPSPGAVSSEERRRFRPRAVAFSWLTPICAAFRSSRRRNTMVCGWLKQVLREVGGSANLP